MWLSTATLAAVLLVGVGRRRFWCRCLCPSGALLSLTAPGRFYERRVGSTCTSCGKCIDACAFGAVGDDFTTRHAACTFCQTCGGACPAGAISFVRRLGGSAAARDHAQTPEPHRAGRRALLAATVGGAAGAACGFAGLSLGRAKPQAKGGQGLIRPPGSVEEERFLDLCVRCGQCIQVCPGPVLHLAGLAAGFEALWTPVAELTKAACHQDCNFCTQVCPTGAIVPLSIKQKQSFHIGLARIDRSLCLAHVGEQDCRLCYEECTAAKYNAIKMQWVKLDIGEIPDGAFSEAELEEMSRIKAPHVVAGACVGCGLCEYRCHSKWVENEKLLPRSAITVFPPARLPEE
jgi:ferredoxin